MARVIKTLTFHFENGGKWIINKKDIGDLWISRVARSIGRINDSDIIEIFPTQSFRIEIYEEADTFETTDINLGALESGMFETVLRSNNIQWMTITWSDNEKDNITFPYEPAKDENSYNHCMSAKISDDNKLYIVIDAERTVKDIYPDA